jgi:hypothetical protein
MARRRGRTLLPRAATGTRARPALLQGRPKLRLANGQGCARDRVVVAERRWTVAIQAGRQGEYTRALAALSGESQSFKSVSVSRDSVQV